MSVFKPDRVHKVYIKKTIKLWWKKSKKVWNVLSMMILPSIVKIYLPSNLIIRLIIILTKISISNFVGTSKLILKFMWRGERPKVAKLRMRSESKLWASTIFAKAAVMKKVWYWLKNRWANQENITEGPETDPGRHTQLWRQDNRAKVTGAIAVCRFGERQFRGFVIFFNVRSRSGKR